MTKKLLLGYEDCCKIPRMVRLFGISYFSLRVMAKYYRVVYTSYNCCGVSGVDNMVRELWCNIYIEYGTVKFDLK